MALVHGFRGQLYDNASRVLYATTTDGWVLDTVNGQWMTAASLAAQMTLEGYVPTVATIPGNGTEIGVPTTAWQDNHQEHPFWGSNVGGREWGDSGAVFPTGGGGGSTLPEDPIKGPFMAFGSTFWINEETCMIGFDLDSDGDPDDWHTGQEVCESTIEDNVKMAISAQLEACGCPVLPCMTAAGNLKKAFTLAVLEPAEDEGGDD